MADASAAAAEAANKVIGVIGDEDTVTGFLLAGVGQKDAKGTNFLVVGASAWRARALRFCALALLSLPPPPPPPPSPPHTQRPPARKSRPPFSASWTAATWASSS